MTEGIAIEIVTAIERVLEGRELDYQKERRRYALLQASAVMVASGGTAVTCVEYAETLLALIEQREHDALTVKGDPK